MAQTELSVKARATALSLHSLILLSGQTICPITYRFRIQHARKVPTLLTGVAIMIALGIVCARLLRQTRPAAQRADRGRPSQKSSGWFERWASYRNDRRRTSKSVS
jgi:hypothetical protein